MLSMTYTNVIVIDDNLHPRIGHYLEKLRDFLKVYRDASKTNSRRSTNNEHKRDALNF